MKVKLTDLKDTVIMLKFFMLTAFHLVDIHVASRQF